MALQQVAVATSEDRFRRRAGTVCLWAGFLGAACGVVLAVVPPQVDEDRYSYPLDAGPFAAFQVFFFLQHLALALGLVGVWRARAAGSRGAGAWGLALAIAGMGLLALVELAAISAGNAPYPSPRTDLLDAGYGITSVVIGVGLVVAGVAVFRARRWTGWRGLLLLVTGVYVFVPMIPALLGPLVLARLAITGWMLLFAALGWVLLRSDARR